MSKEYELIVHGDPVLLTRRVNDRAAQGYVLDSVTPVTAGYPSQVGYLVVMSREVPAAPPAPEQSALGKAVECWAYAMQHPELNRSGVLHKWAQIIAGEEPPIVPE